MSRVQHRFRTWSPFPATARHKWRLVRQGYSLSVRRLGSGDAWLCVGGIGVLRLGRW